MDRPYGAGRLFWKLLMALLMSMVLSTVGAIGFLYWAGGPPPPPHDDLGGLAPLVPLISGVVAMLVTSMGFAWYLSRPLHHLRWALNRIEEGHLDTRVRIRMGTRRDEIVDLAQDFDRMAAELQKLTESRKLSCCTTFLMNCARRWHACRSPLVWFARILRNSL